MAWRCVILFLFFSSQQLWAQTGLPDSLRVRFSTMPHDTTYVNKLNQVAFDFLKTDPSVSRAIAAHTLEIASKLKFTRGNARALTVMGNSYWYEGVYEFAQNYYLLAARQYQSIADSTGIGETYNNIGEVYKRLNEPDQALYYLMKASQIIKNDSTRRALIFSNIGEVYIKQGDLQQARRYIDNSYQLALQLKNKRVIAFNYWNRAALHLKEKNYQAALANYFDAEKIWKDMNEIRSLTQTYQDIAQVYLETKNYKQTEIYLQKAMALATQIKVRDLQLKNHLRYARLDSMRGDFKQAYQHLQQHNLLRDSVYNILKAEQIARLQTVYETENRELENQKLRAAKSLQESKIASQQIVLIAISAGLILAGVLLWILSKQRKEILFQKNAIEVQATALQMLNKDLQELNRTLEARIEERTKQLTLQNKRITEYTFINAHKLRGPVASILGLINLLQEANFEDQNLVLNHLKTCGEQLDKIIHEISKQLEGGVEDIDPR